MVVLDKVENLHNYPEYKKVQSFLSENKNKMLENGRYEIDDNCYVAVSEYNTVEPDGLFEGHLKHIDLQVILEGEEYVHVQEKCKCKLQKTYDEAKDAAFYQANEWHSFYLGKGFFAVFDENDLHRPCISVNGENRVKKYVFKIKRSME